MMSINFWAYFSVLANYIMLREEIGAEYLYAGGLFILVRWLIELRSWRNYLGSVSQILVIPASLYVWQSFGTIFGLIPGLSLLVILIGLKVLERKNFRGDFSFSISVFLLVAAQWILSMDLINSIVGIATVLFFTFYMIRVSSPNIPMSELLGLHWRLWLRGAPLALVLFIFFPRIQGGLSVISAPTVGTTGLSDELRPGSISSLLKSEAPVLQFELKDGVLDSAESMYFKALILTATDGFHWFSPVKRSTAKPLDSSMFLRGTKIRITLEPTDMRWVVLPDSSDEVHAFSPQQLRIEKIMGAGFEFQTAILTKTVYDVELGNGEIFNSIETDDEGRYLQLPNLPKKVQELSLRLSQGALSRQERVRAILRYFDREKFVYSLSPGLASGDALSYFFFESKAGYCEHFASSLAILLRQMRVPSRVVVGYMGAESNGIGEFYTITQASAHAWVEYRDEEGQWLRVDPTEVVAPDRVNLSGGDFRDLLIGGVDRRKQQEFWQVLSTGARFLIESLNYRWTQFVVQYNLSDQIKLMDRLSQGDAIRAVLWALFVIGLSLLFPNFISYFSARKQMRDPVQTGLAELLSDLQKRSFPTRQPQESLSSYLKKIAAEDRISTEDVLKNKIKHFLIDYESYRYKNEGTVLNLIVQIRSLRKSLQKIQHKIQHKI